MPGCPAAELQALTYARTGGKPPDVDFRAILSDAHRDESVVLGAFLARDESPDSLVSFIWGRPHGDHVVYEIGALAFVRA